MTFILEVFEYIDQHEIIEITLSDIIDKYMVEMVKCVDFGNKVLDIILRIIVLITVILLAPGILFGSKLANMLFKTKTK
jgi:hypothetical protein